MLFKCTDMLTKFEEFADSLVIFILTDVVRLFFV